MENIPTFSSARSPTALKRMRIENIDMSNGS